MVSEPQISNESPIQVPAMSSSSDQNPNFNLHTQPPFVANKSLIALNITAQINEQLTPTTFPQWRAQFEALLIGYDLLDYVQGTLRCPSSAGTAADELRKTHWVRQDKLILSAILASTSPSITPLYTHIHILVYVSIKESRLYIYLTYLVIIISNNG